jgi:hypothetical protein
MFLTTPSTTWPSARFWTSSERCSARVSSMMARRETTMLPRRRSILRIWKGCGHVHQRAHVADRADVDLRTGQEGHGAAEIDGEAALDAAEDDAVTRSSLVNISSRRDPGFFAAGLVTDRTASPRAFSMRSR